MMNMWVSVVHQNSLIVHQITSTTIYIKPHLLLYIKKYTEVLQHQLCNSHMNLMWLVCVMTYVPSFINIVILGSVT